MIKTNQLPIVLISLLYPNARRPFTITQLFSFALILFASCQQPVVCLFSRSSFITLSSKCRGVLFRGVYDRARDFSSTYVINIFDSWRLQNFEYPSETGRSWKPKNRSSVSFIFLQKKTLSTVTINWMPTLNLKLTHSFSISNCLRTIRATSAIFSGKSRSLIYIKEKD